MLFVCMVLYIVIGFIGARPLSGHIAYSFLASRNNRARSNYKRWRPSCPVPLEDYPTFHDWAIAVLISVPMMLLLWPAALTWRTSSKVLPSVGAERKHELEQELTKYKEMEKELLGSN